MFIFESEHSKKSIIAAIVFLLLLFAAFRYAAGDMGTVIIIFVLFIIVPGGVTTDSLVKEYTKGYMKFLHILPINRTRLWLTRTALGLIHVVVIIATLSTILFFMPSNIHAPKFIKFTLMNIFTWGFLLIGLGIYSYAFGLLCAGFCQSPITAILLNVFMVLSLPIVLLYLYLYYGIVPAVFDLTLLFSISSLPLFVGSYVLFKHRNPFLEQKWKWRKIAAIFTLVTFLILALSYELLGIRKKQSTVHYYYGIKYFNISPDKKYIYVYAFKSPIMCDHYLLDSQGNLVMDMGRIFNRWGMHEIWPSRKGSNFLIYDESHLQFPSGQMNFLPLKVVNFSNRDISMLYNLNVDNHDFHYYYRCLSRNGEYLYGEKMKILEYRCYTCAIFKQNISTGQIVFADISPPREDMEVSVQFLPNDLALITNKNKSLYGRGYSGFRKKDEKIPEPNETITIMNLHNFSQNVYNFPDHTENWQFTPDGKTLIALQRIPFENYVEYHLIALDLAAQKHTTLLKPPDLPRLDLQDLLNDRRITFDFSISPSGRWISYVGDPNDQFKREWMMDWQDHRKYIFLQYKNTHYKDPYYFSLGNIKYNKDESRLAVTFNHIRNRETPIEKKWTQLEIYDWIGKGFSKTYSYELPYNCSDFNFLDDNRILFIKPGKPRFLSDTDELWVLHLDSGRQHRFFQQTPSPP